MSTAKGTILVTGANGGLGCAIVEQIASKPELAAYHGLYTVRDAKTAPALKEALARGASSHAHDILSLELTKLDSVRQVAAGVNARVSSGEIPPIRALILNAGFIEFAQQSWTADGLDTTFAANYLGHFLLTLLLLGSMDKEAGRIIIVSSQAHDPHDKRNDATKAFEKERQTGVVQDEASFAAIAKGTWSTAKEDSTFRSGFRRYGAAKLFMIMMMHELQRRVDAEATLNKICLLGVDPGAMITGAQRRSPWIIRVFLFKLVYPLIVRLFPNGETVRPPKRSAADVLEAAFAVSSPSDGGKPKDRYFDGRRPVEPCAEANEVEKRKLVWTESVKLVGLKEGDTVLADWH